MACDRIVLRMSSTALNKQTSFVMEIKGLFNAISMINKL